jgi:hypothetical protein
MLERLEERETPAAVAVSSSSTSFIAIGSSALPVLSLVQQVRMDVSTMTSLNSKLNTDITTLKNDINAAASAQTIAGDMGKATSDFAQITTLNNSVQSLAKSGQLSALLSLVSALTAGKKVSGAAMSMNNNNESDDSSSKSSKSGSMTSITTINLGLGLISLLSLSQEAKMASSIFSMANTTASQTLPDNFPTVASNVSP